MVTHRNDEKARETTIPPWEGEVRAAGEQHVPMLNGMMRGSAVRQQIPNVLTYVPGRGSTGDVGSRACGVFAEQKSLACGIVQSKQNPLARAAPPARFGC